ncbi:hypothetical protein H8F01_14735 [Dyella telluris]|uniref:Uncharacterized protein n=2 Tax=Dyella telluris TaxID=2763498 RepID=A0A7G8Q0Q2_9GAMM|nr:hypothetical protein H8F01_14735 [Dyella telluris]
MHVSFLTMARIAKLGWLWRSLFDVRWRWNGITRYETGRDLFSLDRDKWLTAMAGGVQERLIDRRIHVGQQRSEGVEHLPDMVAIGQRIADVIAGIWAQMPKRLVILSPLHYVSQYANVLAVHEVQRALGLANVAIVSGVPRDQYGSDESVTPGIEILHTHGDGMRNSLGIRLARSLRRDRVAVLFADAAPYSMQKYPMDTVEVSMLGRPSRIHGGIFRMGQIMDVLLLPYYLTFERGRFDVVLFDPVELADATAPQRVADCIGRALTQHYENNLFAGYPTLYGFAPVR